jgi:hypothetical protein
MKLSEIQDPESYLYIKAVVALSSKFKVGDYVKTFNFSEYDDNGDDFDTPKWVVEQRHIASFRSQIDSGKNHYVKAPILKRITTISDGYIEAEEVKIDTSADDDCENYYYDGDARTLTGYEMREEVDSFLGEFDYGEQDADEVVELFVNSYIQLDEEYADSIIMESEFIPYANSLDIKAEMLKVKALKAAEQQELLRRSRIRGWETRRANIARAKEEARRSARAVARAKKAALAKKAVKKTVKKRK